MLPTKRFRENGRVGPAGQRLVEPRAKHEHFGRKREHLSYAVHYARDFNFGLSAPGIEMCIS